VEEGACVNDVAVGSGLTGVEDVEEKMELLSTGSDVDGELQPRVVMVSRDGASSHRLRCRW
jgi:hypothetical protein